MSGAEAVIAIQLVVAAIAIAGSIASAVIARKALGNAIPDPDLKKHPTADEGAAAAWLFGTKNRVSGQLIYLSDTRLVAISGESKGKTTQVAAWNYKVDLAIGWCRNVCDPDPINKIWASGELIYAREHSAVITIPDVFWRSRLKWSSFEFWLIQGNAHVSIYCDPTPRHPRERVSYAIGVIFFDTTIGSDVDLECSLVASQMLHVKVTVTGSDSANNNGTYDCIYWRRTPHPDDNSKSRWHIELFRGSFIYKTLDDILAAGGETTELCDPIVNPGLFDVIFDADITLSFTVTGVSQYFPTNGLETYRGDNNQLPDVTLTAAHGGNDTPAFRGTCYTRINALDITKWAGTVPHFEADIRVHADQQFARDAFDAVLDRNESTSSYTVDTSEIGQTYEPVFGLSAMGPTSPTTTLKILMQLFDVEAQERLIQTGNNQTPAPVLFFTPRSELPVKNIEYDLTSAREFGDEGTVHATVKRGTRDELPQEFILDYTEIERDLQPGTASFSVATGGVRNTQKLSVPISTTQPGADRLVKKLLWKAINFHDKVEFTLPATHYGITEGDRLQLDTPSDGLPIVCRVAQIDIGQNGLLEIKADIDDDLIYDQFENGGYSDATDTQVVLPLNAQPKVFDTSPLVSAHASQFGIYLVNVVPEITGSITYSFYYSRDQVNWSPPISVQQAGVTGSTESILEPPDEVHAWDFANTVDVRLDSESSLESVSQEEVEQGLNWALIGTEVIGFMTATLLPTAFGGDVYTLSGLLRGRNDTESSAEEPHPLTSEFVLLGPSSTAVVFLPLEPSLYRASLYFTVVPSGSAISDGVAVQVFPNAETLRPFSVHATWGIKRPNGDVCVFATPRTRVPFRLLSELIPPFVEEGPASDYVADIFWQQGNSWVYARTIEACDAQHPGQLAFSYDSAMQDIDLNQTGLLSPPYTTTRYQFLIKRVSDTIGDGREVEFCIADVGVEYDGTDCVIPL